MLRTSVLEIGRRLWIAPKWGKHSSIYHTCHHVGLCTTNILQPLDHPWFLKLPHKSSKNKGSLEHSWCLIAIILPGDMLEIWDSIIILTNILSVVTIRDLQNILNLNNLILTLSESITHQVKTALLVWNWGFQVFWKCFELKMLPKCSNQPIHIQNRVFWIWNVLHISRSNLQKLWSHTFRNSLGKKPPRTL